MLVCTMIVLLHVVRERMSAHALFVHARVRVCASEAVRGCAYGLGFRL